MALKATLSVLFGCNFGQASRLLAAAERGEDKVVQQVLHDKPQLAAFAGFHGTTSPLHRAAAAGHLEVCRAIIEPLKARIRGAEGGPGRRAGAAADRWRKLLSTVLNQRSHKSLTPLMLACEQGHAGVAAYLLREGADPLASDFVHSRTCLHYAAVGGHADCLRLLCSDTALVATEGSGSGATRHPLRDVIVVDAQVQACRFIDQRAFGGLTALHFAVVTGNLDAVQALLRAGASIMVKSDGEAYIGDDFLVPGSTPLHVAVIINSISIVHAILQAHMEMMNILGTRLDERGRRPWEGTSRTDIRSVRNQFRKLPFHLARERQQPQLMGLVDPRIPIDVALDAARDTEHGIGPKRLGTICSLVLQRSLLQWLDDCQKELAREAAAKQQAAAAAAAEHAAAAAPQGRQQQPLSAALAAMASVTTRQSRQGSAGGKAPPRLAKLSPGGSREGAAGGVDTTSPPATAGASFGGIVAHTCQVSPAPEVAPAAAAADPDAEATTPRGEAVGSAAPRMIESPFAAVSALGAAAAEAAAGEDGGDAPRRHTLPGFSVSASAPVTPVRNVPLLGQESQPATVGAVTGLAAAVDAAAAAAAEQEGGGSMQRMASLHGYMGMLSLKRSQGSTQAQLAAMTRQVSGSTRGVQLARSNSGGCATITAAAAAAGAATTTTQTARVRFLTDPTGTTLAGGSGGVAASSPRSVASLEEALPTAGAAAATITVVPQHRRASSQSSVRLGGMFGLRDRLRSGEITPPGAPAAAAAAAAAAAQQEGSLLAGEKPSEKDLSLESEGEPPSPSCGSEDDAEDMECGVCLDAAVEVAFAACQHKLCLECARNLTRQDKKPPHCPFCRRLVVGFQRVSMATSAGGGSSSRCCSPDRRGFGTPGTCTAFAR